ncbi:MAG: hypothetical protein JO323_00950 [Acidobacteriia bacterium]|nr:hypothetical protein [Terriglobia bacterium]
MRKPAAVSFTMLGMLALPLTASAQGQSVLTGGGVENRPAPKGATPRTADGKPDLSGVWGPDRNFIYDVTSALKPGETLPLLPWAAELTKKRLSKEDPEANCLPTGVPRMAPYPWKILQTRDVIVFLFEGNIHSYRQIFLDGRAHPVDVNPTWYGDSIGHWEGDTLVVDSVGFNDRFWFDFAGHPHTDKLHIVERYRRPDLGHLDDEVTIEDPGAYSKPFKMYGHFPLQTGTEIMEYICNENNVDLQHIVGKDSRK